MRKILLAVTICLSLLGNSQVVREGNTFKSSPKKTEKAEPKKTQFLWEDSKGNKYPIYITSTGRCFVLKTSKKTGKQYKQYLGEEVSREVCKQLKIEYKEK